MTGRQSISLADGYGLHVVAGSRSRPPYATFSCPCGHLQRARGVKEVTQLVQRHADHYDHCPLRMEEVA